MELLSEQTAIVTGGTRGIGSKIVSSFIEHGASVAFFGTDEVRGSQILKDFQKKAKKDQKIAFYKVNVSNYQEVESSITQVYEDFNHVEILVNNAGITRDSLLIRLSENDWQEVINTNLNSVYNTCRSLVRRMMKVRRGKIINIGSIVGLIGNAGQTNYAASKAGMIGFTKSLAKEVSRWNISVNCIAPGFIETDMTKTIQEKQREAILNQIPMHKFGRPEDIGNAALFLASSMADYITGEVLTVDGGMAMS
ncbi:MAG: 3-oxoacyl-ACP reductase FabG [Chlamydiales bacterium]